MAGLLVPIAALGVYLATMPGTITWAHYGADGGDLITAAYVLGVPHPPGYPLYVVIGHLFTWLPWGTVAFRLHLLSAVSAAGAAGLLAAAVARRTSLPAGLVAGLVFAFGPVMWSQAIIAEVYAVNALVVAGVLWVALASGGDDQRTRGNAGFVLGFLWGLGWTTHLTTALLAPLVWQKIEARRRQVGNRAVWQASAGWLLGLSPFLLLPVLAAGRPVINWGDPLTVERWWRVVTGEIYRGYAFSLPLADWPGRAAALAQFAAGQLTLPGVLLAAWAAYRLKWHRRSQARGAILSAVLIAVYALVYNTADSHVLLIPAWMLAAGLLAVGVHRLAQISPRKTWLGWVALVIPVYLLIANWGITSLRGDREAVDFGAAVLEQSPPDALVYTETDRHTFALWYSRFAEGARPDLTVINRDLLAQPWYQAVLSAQDANWLAGMEGRPVCAVSRDGELNCGP